MTLEFNFKNRKGYVYLWRRGSESCYGIYIAEINRYNKKETKKIEVRIPEDADDDIRNLILSESVNRSYYFGEQLDYNNFPSDEEWEAAANAADEAAEAEAWEYIEKLISNEIKTPVVRRYYWEK
jgi:hypothetical protein